MDLEIVKYPSKILSNVSQDVTDFGSELKSLLKDMEDSLDKAKGSGISAVQIGVLKNVFLARPYKNDKSLVFINPTIVSYGDEIDSYEEGCLSFPGVYADIDRPTSLTIEFFNTKGKKMKTQATGFLARIIQHEYDHLKGKMFFENTPKVKQKLIIKEFEKLERISSLKQ